MPEAKNKTSRIIAEKWNHFAPGSLNKEIIEAFIYIIDNCVGCEKTARHISDELIKTTKEMIHRTSLEIIEDLEGDDYFFPDKKIVEKLKKIKSMAILLSPREISDTYVFGG
ncbi:MAG: hypothetical protein V3574_05570 [Candidatus Moraniibacteriota bacterium]